MAHEVHRGEIWMYTFAPPNKQRPVLVLSAPFFARRLNEVTVAEITSTLRDSPAEVVLGVEEGLKHPSAVNLVHVNTVSKTRLQSFRGTVSADKMKLICQALAIATGCGG